MDRYDSIAVKHPIFLAVSAILCWLIAVAYIIVAALFYAPTVTTMGHTVAAFLGILLISAFFFAVGVRLWQMKKVTVNPMAIVRSVGRVGGFLLLILLPIVFCMAVMALMESMMIGPLW